MKRTPAFAAGAAHADITPEGAVFLCGYPHVERISAGVHDRLSSSALFLSDGDTPLLFVANDVAAVSKAAAGRSRQRIQRETGIPATHVMITATHTHSGPLTGDMLCAESDPAVPKTDPRYLRRLEDGIVEAAVRAHRNAGPARIGLAIADGSCVGESARSQGASRSADSGVGCTGARHSGVCGNHAGVQHASDGLACRFATGKRRLSGGLPNDSCRRRFAAKNAPSSTTWGQAATRVLGT